MYNEKIEMKEKEKVILEIEVNEKIRVINEKDEENE